MVQHPRRAEHRVRPRAVVLKSVAMCDGFAFSVEIAPGVPHRLDPPAVEPDFDGRKARQAMKRLDARPAPSNAAIVVLLAIRLDCSLEAAIWLARHVCVCRPTIDHGLAEVPTKRSAIDNHRAERHVVVPPADDHRHIPNLAGVLGGVVASHDHPATPLGQAKREHTRIDMLLIGEKVLEKGCGFSGRRPQTQDPVRRLSEEQLVLVLVATHHHAHGRIMLHEVADAGEILEVPTADRRPFGVALLVPAMRGVHPQARTPAYFVLAWHPLRARAAVEVEVRIDVVATMLATPARKRRHAAARVHDDADPLRRRADQHVNIVVCILIDVTV
mmetsp:Transcript_20480/g.59366  ORF Transcript_20480/g.59366 Transcript_20480/m.59366 type:complete len:330 (+) Transcript_20480:539-1528(+)